MNTTGKALKRFGRYVISYAIAGGIKYAVELISATPLSPLFQPALAGAIAGVGKWIRGNWNIRVPF